MVLQTENIVSTRDVRQVPLASKVLAANAVNSIDLPLVGPILGIQGRIDVNHDNDAAGNTPEEDGLGRLLSNLSIFDGSQKTYFGAHDGRLLQYLSNFTNGSITSWPSTLASVTGGGGQRTESFNFFLDFQDSPTPGGRRMLSPEAAILTREIDLSELTFQFRAGVFNTLSTAGDLTVNSITLTLTPIIVLWGTESHRRLMAQGVAKPIFRSRTESDVSASGQAGLEFNLPNGFLISKTVLIAVDGSNDRGVVDADIVSSVAYEDKLVGQIPFSSDWTDHRRGLQSLYFGDGTTLASWSNVSLLDWEGIVGGGGLQRRGRQPGDDVLLFTGVAAGDLLLLHKGFGSY